VNPVNPVKVRGVVVVQFSPVKSLDEYKLVGVQQKTASVGKAMLFSIFRYGGQLGFAWWPA
jgi:hypothetical protein